VILNPAVHRQVLEDVLAFAQMEGFGLGGLIRSPLTGPKGNVEFLTWLRSGEVRGDLNELIARVLEG
jgi:23S rRNA (cytidine1920-2'-O)/16S rRNA (cytidine1409-2'-O)-methyltransferase